jgi:hypothetical protein
MVALRRSLRSIRRSGVVAGVETPVVAIYRRALRKNWILDVNFDTRLRAAKPARVA